MLERTFPEEYSRRALSKPTPAPAAEAADFSLEDLVQLHLKQEEATPKSGPIDARFAAKAKVPFAPEPVVPKLPKPLRVPGRVAAL